MGGLDWKLGNQFTPCRSSVYIEHLNWAGSFFLINIEHVFVILVLNLALPSLNQQTYF